jgi:hypothetical protein
LGIDLAKRLRRNRARRPSIESVRHGDISLDRRASLRHARRLAFATIQKSAIRRPVRGNCPGCRVCIGVAKISVDFLPGV